MLQQIAEDCQYFVSVCQDSKDIEESNVSYIKKYATKNKNQSPTKSGKPKKKQNILPTKLCFGCR